MKIYYTARSTFGDDYDENGLKWKGYAAWKRLTHQHEIVTLDNTLNQNLVQFDQVNSEEWEQVVIQGVYRTNLYKNLDYVLIKVMPKDRFNLLAVAIELEKDCANITPEGFEFVGYDLLDDSYSLSSLTNCDGFILSYTPDDINQYGLLKDFDKAYDVKKRLLADNPGHGHEETYVAAIWRHKTIGRKEAVLNAITSSV